MSAPSSGNEARQFDPRREQQTRLVEAARTLGSRLAETFNSRMEAWLGPEPSMKFLGAEIAYGPSNPTPGRVALGLRGGPPAPRLYAAGGFFFRYYESMLSGPAIPAAAERPRPRAFGATETLLGAELGARWIACLPGSPAAPKAADVWVLPAEDAPPLPESAWPMLRLQLALAGEDTVGLEILVSLNLLEGGAAVKAAATRPPAGAPPSDPLKRLSGTPLRVQAMLGTVRLRLKELYELRPGDCVLLEGGPAEGAVLRLGNEAVFRVKPGRNGRRLAVQIVGAANVKHGG